MVTTTKYFVCNFCSRCDIADDYLFTFDNHDTTNGTSVMGRARTTPTQGFNLQSIYSVG
jgi:hypothetical protein